MTRFRNCESPLGLKVLGVLVLAERPLNSESQPLKIYTMRSLLWIIDRVLIIGWLIGYMGFGAAVGNFIHILLVLAIIFILI